MNPKAESFRKYLDTKGLRAFQSEEIPDDEFQTVCSVRLPISTGRACL